MSQVTHAEDVRVLIPADEIARRRQELAEEITRDYEGEELVMVCILKGSMPIFVDLARDSLATPQNNTFDFAMSGPVVLVGARFASPRYSEHLPQSWYRKHPRELVSRGESG